MRLVWIEASIAFAAMGMIAISYWKGGLTLLPALGCIGLCAHSLFVLRASAWWFVLLIGPTIVLIILGETLITMCSGPWNACIGHFP